MSLGPLPQRIDVEADLVRRLIDSRFPQWRYFPIRPVANGGWDNWTFHLGPAMSVRLPSAAEYALAVEKEHRWLPRLAPRLPLPVPVPLAQGSPGFGYPFSWSVYPWIDGTPLTPGALTDPPAFAASLAGFLLALRAVDPGDGPAPGLHNWYRGGSLRRYDGEFQRALGLLGDRVDADRARVLWKDALDAPWDGEPTWFHGDIALGNLLLDAAGDLSAVIDFGTCGVGDPSCDLAIAWTVLTADARELFRAHLCVPAAEWTRGRGWALWKTLVTCAHSSSPEPFRALTEILSPDA
ncbi:aminoglycoside phosphotransferase family protein [Actinoplanes sp. NPDC051851]|uniref:aminoglycoside phosphotransferase family protein n=1 Tax=Actinoplanes sp. NPDC051851 TaxID=3154753 RepID=UPI00341B0E6D